VDALGFSYAHNPHLYAEDPVMTLKRNVWVHPFWEDDPKGLVDLVGADRVVFGSDYPHAEGMAEPLSYVEELAGLPPEDIARVMGGNLADALKLPATAA
jgi:predicted TIM-barrel fold metal-dependent hydrolase